MLLQLLITSPMAEVRSTAIIVFVCLFACMPQTRYSASAEGPHDMLCQLKACQLLQSCTGITYERLAIGNKLEGDARSLVLPLMSLLICGLW